MAKTGRFATNDDSDGGPCNILPYLLEESKETMSSLMTYVEHLRENAESVGDSELLARVPIYIRGSEILTNVPVSNELGDPQSTGLAGLSTNNPQPSPVSEVDADKPYTESDELNDIVVPYDNSVVQAWDELDETILSTDDSLFVPEQSYEEAADDSLPPSVKGSLLNFFTQALEHDEQAVDLEYQDFVQAGLDVFLSDMATSATSDRSVTALSIDAISHGPPQKFMNAFPTEDTERRIFDDIIGWRHFVGGDHMRLLRERNQLHFCCWLIMWWLWTRSMAFGGQMELTLGLSVQFRVY